MTLRQRLTALKERMTTDINDVKFLDESEEIQQAYLTGLEKLIQFEDALVHLKTLLDNDYVVKQHKLNASKD